MKAPLKIVAGASALAMACLAWWLLSPGGTAPGLSGEPVRLGDPRAPGPQAREGTPLAVPVPPGQGSSPGSTVDAPVEAGAVEEKAVPGEVVGQVRLLRDRAPVERAEVTLRMANVVSGHKESAVPLSQRSGASGEFRFQAVASGTWNVHVEKDGYAPRDVIGLVLTAEHGLQPVEVFLSVGGGIEGRVTGTQGEPIPGAAISMQRVMGGANASSIETDLDGGYRFEHLLPGQVLVRCRRGSDAFQSAMVVIVDGQAARVDFRTGAALTGLLLNAGGDPIPRAVVMATSARGSKVERGKTDAEGRFRIDGLEPGAWTLDAQIMGDLSESVVAEAGYAGYSVRAGRIEMASVDQDVTLRLESGEIHGKVLVAASGQPLAFPEVTLQLQAVAASKGSGAGGQVVGVALAGKDGTYRFLRLGEGRYQLFANATDKRLRPHTQVVDLVSGERKEVAIALESCRSGMARFTVRDPEGRPVEGARFAIVDGATVAAADVEPGGYRAEMEVGTWVILVSAPGMQARRVSVDVGETEPRPVEVVLKWAESDVSSRRASGEIAGRVADVDGRVVPQGVTVTLCANVLQPRPDGGWMPGKQVSSLRPAEDGSFRIRELPAGRYRLTAIPSPRIFRTKEVDVTLTAGRNLEGVDIRLEKCESGRVRLVVKDAQGGPVLEVKFATVAGGTMTTLGASSPEPGVYEAALELGTHRVAVFASGYESSRIELNITGSEGQETAVTLRSTPR